MNTYSLAQHRILDLPKLVGGSKTYNLYILLRNYFSSSENNTIRPHIFDTPVSYQKYIYFKFIRWKQALWSRVEIANVS